MSIQAARRALLYFFGAFFIVFGLVGLFAPALLAAKVNLMPANIAGIGEMRGLYGGGFIAFGLVTLAGLRSPSVSRGMLLAMSIITGGIVIGRVFGMAIDHDYGATAPDALPEVLMALCFYFESRRGLAVP
jgi:Domain of unknown function (DUF4345)